MIFSNPNIQRTHDSFYKNNKATDLPKDSFIMVADLIEEYESGQNLIEIADIGSAAGNFVSYLSNRLDNHNIVGYEFLEYLVKAAKSNFPELNFQQASILDRSIINKSQYNVITVLGVLSIFDDIEPAVANLSYWIRPNGRLYIHGMFNPYEIDVFVKYRKSRDYKINQFESGWNVISQSTISKLLKKYGAKEIFFHEFKISVDLGKKPGDPVRSWTEKLANGERQIVNGICLKQPQYILEARF